MMTRRLLLLILAAALPLAAVSSSPARAGTKPAAGSVPTRAAAPEWFTRHLEFLVQGSGRWIADNTPFKSESEPFDAYGMEWRWGVGRKSATGRLFAIRDGKELGDIWQFRLAWDPGRGEARAMQFGSDGSFGDGVMTSTGPRETRAEQTFFNPDGSKMVVGHETTEAPGEQITRSFSIAADGSRSPRRTYTWRLAPRAD